MPRPAFALDIGAPSSYRRAKALLNAGRHPAFVGPNMAARCAAQGGLLFAVIGRGANARDAAVALVNVHNSTLLVLNVHPSCRRAGFGAAFLQFLRPNFARVVTSAVPWFQRQGYTALGMPHCGHRLQTQIMVRQELLGLAGRAARRFADACPCPLSAYAPAAAASDTSNNPSWPASAIGSESKCGLRRIQCHCPAIAQGEVLSRTQSTNSTTPMQQPVSNAAGCTPNCWHGTASIRRAV